VTSQGLADAIRTALGDPGAPVFDTDVTGSQALPWVVFSCGLPRVSERSLGHRPLARHGYVLVKCAAGTGQGARTLGDAVDDALEGARLNVAGWTLGAVGLLNVREPQADYEVTVTSGVRPVVQVLEYRFTAVRSA